MIHWYERVAAPVIGGGLVWLYGTFQQQGSGYKIFVRYAAGFAFGLFAIIATHDLLERLGSGLSVVAGFVWVMLVGYIGWRRHLA